MASISAPTVGNLRPAAGQQQPQPQQLATPSPPPIAAISSSSSGRYQPRIAAAKPPRITIQIPSATAQPLRAMPPTTPASLGKAHHLETPMPPSISAAGSPYANPFSSMMYPTTGFVFKQLEGFKDFTFSSAKSGLNIGEKVAFYIYEKFSKWSRKWFTHCFLFIVIFLYSVAGAFAFVALEGPQQQRGIVFVRELKHNFSEALHQLAQDKRLQADLSSWQGAVDRELLPFIGNLTAAIKAGHFDEDQKAKPPTWSFWNAMFYCGTIYTTIGYGHIYPATNAGRALTMVYAIIGIPMFLILLADFGKLFTRAIKVLWRYVRRLYYTGSLRKVRKQAQVQEVLRGMNIAYEVATFRRPSMMMREAPELQADAESGLSAEAAAAAAAAEDAPTTPAPTDIDIDDEQFNLPISLAFFLLIAYILCGAAVYSLWEDWTFFEASYFVFISMSTIGFGDYVPKHPMFMMASIVYLVFGLALTSMCINVVQVKLSDSFRAASAKISETIGVVLAEQEAAAAAEEESRRSESATPAPRDNEMGSGGGDGGGRLGEWPRPAAKATVVDGGGEAEERVQLVQQQLEQQQLEQQQPPALPPKKALVNEAQQAAQIAAEEVKKRRRFWK